MTFESEERSYLHVVDNILTFLRLDEKCQLLNRIFFSIVLFVCFFRMLQRYWRISDQNGDETQKCG